ncbi:MAG TPA: family 43 glycosylhydrolase [Prolixibacteraceae bacterium]|nr:family 43 glycosylhydrolase [Prolixibacteraceae bacterium]
MRYMQKGVIILLFFMEITTYGFKKDNGGSADPKTTVDTVRLAYVNPVFQPVLADPTIVRKGDFFYAYGTEDNWGTEGGYHLVPVLKSHNLVTWTYLSDALQHKPSWKPQGGIWAPDVTEVDGKYLMYYSFSVWGDSNPGIGLAIADRPEGPFIDQGKVFDSNEIGVINSIDPFFMEENGVKYLFWGSFHGIYAVKLSDDGRQAEGEKIQLAYTNLEGVYIHKRNGFYYLFGSEGTCCEGANSTYRVKVGRSTQLLGPYVDKDGNKLVAGSYGELILRSNDDASGFAGPGHNAEIITDDQGNDWMLYHAMRKSKALLSNGTNRRSLMLDKINWVNDWPVILGQQPSVLGQYGPVLN